MKMEKVASLCFVMLACFMACAHAQSASNVTADYTDFKTTNINWDLNAAHVECATVDGDRPLAWRSKYNWTGFCGPVGRQGVAACGLCLKVTNTRTSASTTVRIVDTCGIKGLVLDIKAFDEIDTDGQGRKAGHLTVNYEFVDCQNDCCPCTLNSPWTEL